MTPTKYLQLTALGLSTLAAILGLRAATVHVRDSFDDFIGDLHRHGRWAAWAVVANAFAVAALIAVQFFGL